MTIVRVMVRIETEHGIVGYVDIDSSVTFDDVIKQALDPQTLREDASKYDRAVYFNALAYRRKLDELLACDRAIAR